MKNNDRNCGNCGYKTDMNIGRVWCGCLGRVVSVNELCRNHTFEKMDDQPFPFKPRRQRDEEFDLVYRGFDKYSLKKFIEEEYIK